MPQSHLLRADQEGDTLVLVPTRNMGEFEFQQIDRESRDMLTALQEGRTRNVVIDCHETDFFGSTALGFFLKLWKRVCQHGGRMALCNLSEHEREVLQATRLDTLWIVRGTRAEALAAVREPPQA
jgi:anti-anti-sigma factor